MGQGIRKSPIPVTRIFAGLFALAVIRGLANQEGRLFDPQRKNMSQHLAETRIVPIDSGMRTTSAETHQMLSCGVALQLLLHRLVVVRLGPFGGKVTDLWANSADVV